MHRFQANNIFGTTSMRRNCEIGFVESSFCRLKVIVRLSMNSCTNNADFRAIFNFDKASMGRNCEIGFVESRFHRLKVLAKLLSRSREPRAALCEQAVSYSGNYNALLCSV